MCRYTGHAEFKVTDCHGIKGNNQYDNHLKVREATHHYFTCSMHRVTKEAKFECK